MRYILSLIVITGLAVGVYFLQQERPEYVQPPSDCGAVVITTNECLGEVITR